MRKSSRRGAAARQRWREHCSFTGAGRYLPAKSRSTSAPEFYYSCPDFSARKRACWISLLLSRDSFFSPSLLAFYFFLRSANFLLLLGFFLFLLLWLSCSFQDGHQSIKHSIFFYCWDSSFFSFF
jgi:hypothetical protein